MTAAKKTAIAAAKKTAMTSSKPTVVTIVGARPQFIKCAPVSVELRQQAHEILVHTGQHYDDNMNEVFFRELELPEPDYNLGVGSGSQGSQTGAMLEGIEKVLLRERPEAVLLYGDTNSTLAGALAAVKLGIPIVHVEAGLRSFNRQMPEEINRVITDTVSSLLCCPTQTAIANLSREGIKTGVHLVGDVMLDSLRRNIKLADRKSKILERLGLKAGSYFLATVHRAENADDPHKLGALLAAFTAVCETGSPVVFPVHPRTRLRLEALGAVSDPRLIRIDPVSYLDMLALEKSARAVLTDSGGVQKEAFWLGVPCVTLRDETEWVETVKSGWNTVAGTDPGRILRAVRRRGRRPARHLPAGSASRRIVRLLPSAFRSAT